MKKTISGKPTSPTITTQIMVIMTTFTYEPVLEIKKMITFKKSEMIDNIVHPMNREKNL
jgi:hypothetical protein